MFNSISGQERIKKSLTSAVLKNQVSHAYLFVGPDGIGKEYFAETFARILLCEAPPAERPCGVCNSCRQMDEGVHTDFIKIAPAEGSRNIKIGQIREIIRIVSSTTFSGNVRVTLILNGESMTVEAQNALLKSLEEPEPGNIFIITAENAERVLPTIRSRCQTFIFEPLSDGEIKKILSDHGCDPDDIDRLTGESAGLPGRALSMMAGEENEVLKSEAFETIYAILKGDEFPIFRFAEKMSRAKTSGIAVADDLIRVLSDTAEALASGGFSRRNPRAEKLCAVTDVKTAAEAVEILFDLTKRLSTNAQPRIQWEAALLKIFQLRGDR